LEVSSEGQKAGNEVVTFVTRKEKRRLRFKQDDNPQQQQHQQQKAPTWYPPKTRGQHRYQQALDANRFVVSEGPAGSGKTLMAVQRCVRLLMEQEVKRIVLARPAVAADEQIGFLPGGIKEKLDPYLRPLYDALEDILGVQTVDQWIRESKVTIAPLGYLRGRTLKQSAIVLDEAQNATYSQLKMVVTRLGEGSYMFLTGDKHQSDIGAASGYPEFITRVKSDFAVVELGNADVVRDPIVAKLLNVL
jgi:phosphate starvation-inducible PhoH-like protein